MGCILLRLKKRQKNTGQTSIRSPLIFNRDEPRDCGAFGNILSSTMIKCPLVVNSSHLLALLNQRASECT